jgi:hypothetical protein
VLNSRENFLGLRQESGNDFNEERSTSREHSFSTTTRYTGGGGEGNFISEEVDKSSSRFVVAKGMHDNEDCFDEDVQISAMESAEGFNTDGVS